MHDPRNVKILAVDDNAAQRLALVAILSDLNVTVVEATSGRDALRHILADEFAVILLDVRMPDLDGFETASLIRERPASEHTPIIFVTAYSDDAYAARGYALGAVDYILAPVHADVLRAKVSVFIDLYTKTEEIKRQREDVRRYASQLQQLSEASLGINSAQSTEDVLQIVNATSARIIGAHQARTSALLPDGTTSYTVVQLSEKLGGYHNIDTASHHPVRAVLATPKPVCLPANELARAAAWREPTASFVDGIPLSGLLAAPLTGRNGRNIGYVEVSEKAQAHFCAEDERILVQLAQMASIAIENIITSDAREANRLKDEFLGVLSHELRTPLQAMLTWIAVLRKESVDAATTARGLEVIERSVKSQCQLIEDLLDVSRIIRGQLRLDLAPVDLGRVIDSVVEALKPAATTKGIQIVKLAPPHDCRAIGDANRIQQVLLNLVSNAIKFTPDGGRVEIALIEQTNRVGLRVRDSGRGIPADFLPYVFERFRQADRGTGRQHGGLGLGLAIVRHLTELQGGTVEAGNAPDGGAVFTVMLQRAPTAATGATVPAASNGSAIFGSPVTPINGVRLDGISVVLVDDEPDTRECLATGLRLYGAEVIAVESVAAALAALDHNSPHVLLSDIAMPGEDGHALIRLVRAREAQRGGRLPAAALTAHVRPEERADILESGFDTHVGKPVQPLELAQVVKHLAATGETRSQKEMENREPRTGD